MDILLIKKLTVMAFIGIYEWEQQRLQKLVLDLELGCDNKLAACSDDISDSINYVDISEAVLSLVSGNYFALIERVAEEIANMLLNKFSLPWVRIKVTKPSALPQAVSVGIIIQRSRKK
ncbi:dihydroneopterin aldolase [Candidatus Palibaumannia cicadellinicola]|uniref:7,8-dihydroneopterin aldolase n=1 Tax=Candidatus Palibaumannia cicadellinicola TaxID=186490 RepID=A0A0K2BLE0_9GAMM|nr:dihydroneopterin aldolase [Candidatus Baumannia cicadellinicola]AKZ66140.1 Dihydroneopterin aldolase [Candidatus Baumannia cicadellinicola]